MTLYDTDGNDYTPIMLKDVKLGEFITRKPNLNKVYIRGSYARENKKFSLTDMDDFNRYIYLTGETIVYTGFTY